MVFAKLRVGSDLICNFILSLEYCDIARIFCIEHYISLGGDCFSSELHILAKICAPRYKYLSFNLLKYIKLEWLTKQNKNAYKNKALIFLIDFYTKLSIELLYVYV